MDGWRIAFTESDGQHVHAKVLEQSRQEDAFLGGREKRCARCSEEGKGTVDDGRGKARVPSRRWENENEQPRHGAEK